MKYLVLLVSLAIHNTVPTAGTGGNICAGSKRGTCSAEQTIACYQCVEAGVSVKRIDPTFMEDGKPKVVEEKQNCKCHETIQKHVKAQLQLYNHTITSDKNWQKGGSRRIIEKIIRTIHESNELGMEHTLIEGMIRDIIVLIPSKDVVVIGKIQRLVDLNKKAVKRKSGKTIFGLLVSIIGIKNKKHQKSPTQTEKRSKKRKKKRTKKRTKKQTKKRKKKRTRKRTKKRSRKRTKKRTKERKRKRKSITNLVMRLLTILLVGEQDDTNFLVVLKAIKKLIQRSALDVVKLVGQIAYINGYHGKVRNILINYLNILDLNENRKGQIKGMGILKAAIRILKSLDDTNFGAETTLATVTYLFKKGARSKLINALHRAVWNRKDLKRTLKFASKAIVGKNLGHIIGSMKNLIVIKENKKMEYILDLIVWNADSREEAMQVELFLENLVYLIKHSTKHPEYITILEAIIKVLEIGWIDEVDTVSKRIVEIHKEGDGEHFENILDLIQEKVDRHYSAEVRQALFKLFITLYGDLDILKGDAGLIEATSVRTDTAEVLTPSPEFTQDESTEELLTTTETVTTETVATEEPTEEQTPSEVPPSVPENSWGNFPSRDLSVEASPTTAESIIPGLFNPKTTTEHELVPTLTAIITPVPSRRPKKKKRKPKSTRPPIQSLEIDSTSEPSSELTVKPNKTARPAPPEDSLQVFVPQESIVEVPTDPPPIEKAKGKRKHCPCEDVPLPHHILLLLKTMSAIQTLQCIQKQCTECFRGVCSICLHSECRKCALENCKDDDGHIIVRDTDPSPCWATKSSPELGSLFESREEMGPHCTAKYRKWKKKQKKKRLARRKKRKKNKKKKKKNGW